MKVEEHAQLVEVNESIALEIFEHHFHKKPKKITQLTGGIANFVYEANIDGEDYIIRISNYQPKINAFLKEQWAVNEAAKKGVPGPTILEVGNEIQGCPYMIVKKIQADQALDHPDRIGILREMGKYCALINTIPTNGYGHVFDWSSNTLSKKESWKDFLDHEMETQRRLKIFDELKFFSRGRMNEIKKVIKKMEDWKDKPVLNHGDMRLKNMLVDKEGKIVAILDWENCISAVAPHWDLSIALHDLTIDEKEAFLDGYGIKPKDFEEISAVMKVINILNYADVLALLAEQKDKKTLEWYRVRLNGGMDMFSF